VKEAQTGLKKKGFRKPEAFFKKNREI